MKELETLRAKWRKVADEGGVTGAFDYDKLKPGKFCVHISDVGGTMPCVSEVETTGFFESPRDALAYLRFSEIPRILKWDSRSHDDGPVLDAEAYLHGYEEEDVQNLKALLEAIDKALNSKIISGKALSSVRQPFNDIFTTTNPEFQILAWGNIVELLTDPYFAEAFEEDMGEEADEEERPVTKLHGLLASKTFDETIKGHLSLARQFMERRLIC